MKPLSILLPVLAFTLCSAYAASAATPAPESDLEFLKRLVSISSGTLDAAGVNGVQDAVAIKLKEIGFTNSDRRYNCS